MTTSFGWVSALKVTTDTARIAVLVAAIAGLIRRRRSRTDVIAADALTVLRTVRTILVVPVAVTDLIPAVATLGRRGGSGH